MNRIFEPRGYFKVPDGTYVSAFLNATDTTQDDVPCGALGHVSIAAGRIEPKVHSWVHVHPVVTQVTFVLAGTLTVRMKDPGNGEPYTLPLPAGQAVVVQPGALFQLRNDSDAVAEVLYIVSPSYVFEEESGKIRYDDALLAARTWEELGAPDYDLAALEAKQRAAPLSREESLARLARRRAI